jgi:hypothetical protein
MAKFNVIEKFYYEIEADSLEEAMDRHQEFLAANESDDELEYTAKFIGNKLDFFDEDWNEVLD